MPLYIICSLITTLEILEKVVEKVNNNLILIDGGFFSFEVSARISGARRVLVTYKYQDEDGASLSNRVTVRLRSPRHGSPTVSLEYDEA